MNLSEIQLILEACEDGFESVCSRLADKFGYQDWQWFATSILPGVLGVAPRTVYRWVERGACPMPQLRFLVLLEVMVVNDSGGPEAPTS